MKLLVFVVLKVLEIGTIIFVPYLTGKYVNLMWGWQMGGLELGMIWYWFAGLINLLVYLSVICLLIPMIKEIIKKNWSLAGKITKE